MIILAWCVIVFFVLMVLGGMTFVLTDGFSDWFALLVALGISLFVAVAVFSLHWATGVITTHNQPQKAETTP